MPTNNTIDLPHLLAHYSRVYVIADVAIAQRLNAILPCPLDNYPKLALHVSEQHKSLDMVCRIWDFLLLNHATRDSLIINIGGGIISDLGGFAAATYRRGLDYVNIPTTLLAMVDAAEGGKTGFNYYSSATGGMLKNQIGLFALPVTTYIYPEWLLTLPMEEVLSGYAEIIKTTLLDSAALFQHAVALLIQIQSEGICKHLLALQQLIEWCVTIKRGIVTADPCDKGGRAALNLGHTIGHAIEERALELGTPVQHGFAVIYGLAAELYLSHMMKGLPIVFAEQVKQMANRYFPLHKAILTDSSSLVKWMIDDKKNITFVDGPVSIRCALLLQMGQIEMTTTTDSQLLDAIDWITS